MKLVLKKFAEKRKSNPWIFFKELILPSKKTSGLAELRSETGEFISRGFFNPDSQISYRGFSWDSREQNLFSKEFFLQRLQVAYAKRLSWGFKKTCRLIFSEADLMSGLILDLYFCAEPKDLVVFSLQIQSKTFEVHFQNLHEALLEFAAQFTKAFAIIVHRDGSFRKAEGLRKEEGARILQAPAGVDLSCAKIITSYPNLPEIILQADLLNGQKTGLFLDQSSNLKFIFDWIRQSNQKHFRVLDLCSYVGQWSAFIQSAAQSSGKTAEFVLVDVSEKALAFAKNNLNMADCKTENKNIFRDDLGEKNSFDIVISDPPALLKNPRELPQAKGAYLKLNKKSLALLKPEGILIACSCSRFMEAKSFKQIIQKAVVDSGSDFEIVYEGFQGADHPVPDFFPEAKYLKMIAVQRKLQK